MGSATESQLATASQADCGFVQNSFGQRVSWKGQIPVLFYLDTSVTEEYEAGLRGAAQVWETFLGRKMFKFERTDVVSDKAGRDSRSVISFLNPWNADIGSQQAITHLYWKNNLITEADIVINTDYFDYFIDGENSEAVHFVSLLIHELGHSVGLKHLIPPPTVMYPYLNFGDKRVALSEADQGNIKCEY